MNCVHIIHSWFNNEHWIKECQQSYPTSACEQWFAYPNRLQLYFNPISYTSLIFIRSRTSLPDTTKAPKPVSTEGASLYPSGWLNIRGPRFLPFGSTQPYRPLTYRPESKSYRQIQNRIVTYTLVCWYFSILDYPFTGPLSDHLRSLIRVCFLSNECNRKLGVFNLSLLYAHCSTIVIDRFRGLIDS